MPPEYTDSLFESLQILYDLPRELFAGERRDMQVWESGNGNDESDDECEIDTAEYRGQFYLLYSKKVYGVCEKLKLSLSTSFDLTFFPFQAQSKRH